jgi:hypothetical protein
MKRRAWVERTPALKRWAASIGTINGRYLKLTLQRTLRQAYGLHTRSFQMMLGEEGHHATDEAEIVLYAVCKMDGANHRQTTNVPDRNGHRARLGHIGSAFRIQRYLAARDQYRNDHCHFPDGLPDQSTQNRDTEAMQVKLDELIRVGENAKTALLDLEELEEEELDRIYAEYRALAQEARDRLRSDAQAPWTATDGARGIKR